MPVAVEVRDLLALLALAAPYRAPETEAAFARLWVAARREYPALVAAHERLVAAAEGTTTVYRRLAQDGGEG